MDFQFGRLALFMACLTGLIVFSVYSIRAVRKSGIACYLKGLLFAVGATLAALHKLIIGFVGFLAASAKTSGANEATTNAASGGMLNYRTGKLDDGTDPAGMYEKD
ncbi:MAG: hypothetical protein H6963_10785 [Chromatiaceae bacterium]|nr:hypothetical protein [Chromatiaceae bacterium]